MAYDNPKTLQHTFPLFNFGGGASQTISFRGPAGKKGDIEQIGVMTTEAFASATPGAVRVGTAADPDAYAELVIPSGTAANECFDETLDPDAIKPRAPDQAAQIPADQLVQVTFVNATGGGVAGQGVPFVTIRWF